MEGCVVKYIFCSGDINLHILAVGVARKQGELLEETVGTGWGTFRRPLERDFWDTSVWCFVGFFYIFYFSSGLVSLEWHINSLVYLAGCSCIGCSYLGSSGQLLYATSPLFFNFTICI